MSLTHSVQAHSNHAHSNPVQDAARTMPLHVPSPQSKKLTAEEAWRKLRMPFVLPAAARSVHQCKWELIDFDCAGCVLCGRVHLCSANTCTETAQTEDAVVCLVTGLCVQPKTFAVTEYSDNVIVFSTLKDRMEVMETRMRLVEVYVREIILSQGAENLAVLEHERRIRKYHSMIAKTLRSERIVNLMQLVQAGVCLYTRSVFERRGRERLAVRCTALIQRTICICERNLDLVVKDSEFRFFVLGMIFLMRTGVTMQGLQILRCIPELKIILPSENNVCRHLNFRSKYITDTENKFKYLFRRINRNQLQALHLPGEGEFQDS